MISFLASEQHLSTRDFLSFVEPFDFPPLLATVGILREVPDGWAPGGGGVVLILQLLGVVTEEEGD